MKRHDESTPSAAGQGITCPFCGSADVELLALFGSQLLTDQYYCRACRTPFEHLRADKADETDVEEQAHSGDAAHREE